MILDALSLDFFDTINAQWAIEINRVYTPPPSSPDATPYQSITCLGYLELPPLGF